MGKSIERSTMKTHLDDFTHCFFQYLGKALALSVIITVVLFVISSCGDDNKSSAVIPVTATGEPYITTPPPAGLWTFQYSSGVPANLPIGPNGGFTFTFPAANGVHYLVQNRSSPVSKFRLHYVITGTDPVWNHKPDDCGASTGGTIVFYMQKAGDFGSDMNGRWFSWPAKVDLALGEFTMEAATGDDSRWSNVNGKTQSMAGFSLPSMVPMAAGVTFGGGCAAGHGSWVTPGTATMTADLFEIQ